ncbi:MAG: zf-HC2 domain-containing protein [Candidatus Palauibacterales bacterium]|nr:zf-HC2 domain-containing protein [Candidatus Palauibacterales bacterium]
MIGARRHPSWRDLNRLADGELDPESRARLVEHVADCVKCSRSLGFLRDLREVGGDLRHPSPPKGLLEDVLRNRADGRRLILPVTAGADQRRRRALPAVAAAIVVAGLASLAILFLAPEAGAGASELTFDPATPIPGDQVRLAYRPASYLAGDPTLRLRVRIRRPDSDPPRATLGAYSEVHLVPDRAGLYRGVLPLPPDFAYADMSVESLAGDRVDDHQGRLWGLRAHTMDGIPLLAALRQEFLVLQYRSWPEAREAVHQMTMFYPDRAEGWSLQMAYEEQIQSPAEAAASRAAYREIFRRLEQQGVNEESTAELAAMARFATYLGDPDRASWWMERLETVDPANPLVVSTHVALSGSDTSGADAYLERLWLDEGARSASVYRNGFWNAVHGGDGELARRWALRGIAVDDDPRWLRDAALVLVTDPETRDRGVAEVRTLLDRLGEERIEDRPLDATRSEAREDSRRLRVELQVQLGRQLLASGDAAGAIDELEAADALGTWLPDLYRARLEARLSLGDSLAALPDFHRLDVDPVYPRASVDSLRDRLRALDRVVPKSARRLAEQEMVERVLSDPYLPRGLPGVSLLTSTGQTRTLESLVADRPTILLLWDRRVFGSEEEVATVVGARRLLAGGPGQMLWVTPERDSESLRTFIRTDGLGLSAYHDPRAELANTLGEWGSRSYLVIDRAGTIRARTDILMEAVRYLEVLEIRSRNTA